MYTLSSLTHHLSIYSIYFNSCCEFYLFPLSGDSFLPGIHYTFDGCHLVDGRCKALLEGSRTQHLNHLFNLLLQSASSFYNLLNRERRRERKYSEVSGWEM